MRGHVGEQATGREDVEDLEIGPGNMGRKYMDRKEGLLRQVVGVFGCSTPAGRLGCFKRIKFFCPNSRLCCRIRINSILTASGSEAFP